MKFKQCKYFLFLVSLLNLVGWGPFSFFTPANTEPLGSQRWLNSEVQIITSQASNVDPSVLRLSLIAYLKARHRGLDARQLLTVIDYSKPSSERRLLVIDLKNDKVLFNTYVTHGKNSGNVMPTSFSNRPGSLKSSIGVFETTDSPYIGNNGYSLRLRGLEQGINDNAYDRAIVIHGAWYADSDIIRRYGQLGRSWGCPAVSDRLARPLINTIKEHTLVFVYSNSDKRWLHQSRFLVG
jgi:hypothetical protein